MAAYKQAARPFRVFTPLGDDVLLLEKLEGEELVSRPFEFRLEMLSENDSISAKALIRKPVHVEIDLADGSHRYIHARVSHFIQRGRRQVFTAYTAIVRPWLWFLSLVQDCRIFQNKSVPDIVEQVFHDNSFTDFSMKLYGSYSPREYCVQYRESSLDFVSRLLEEEGIFYYFEHTKDKHTLVLTDSVAGTTTCPGQASASLMPQLGAFLEADAISEVEQEVRARSGQVTLSDYNFQTPNTKLLATASSTDPEEIYDYPGEYDSKASGDHYADIRLQEQEAPEILIRGESNCRPFIAGYKFDLKEHYRRDMNKVYLLTRLAIKMETNAYQVTSGIRDDYSNTFEAVPASIKYRPPRLTARPVIPGVQTAVVVGPGGEEIYSDKYGRVKVQFYWDRKGKKNEDSSCWLRASQDWAGKNWGAIFVPRIGQEVVVEFLEGDPDRPIITGRVYNADQMPPYTLPDNQTQSGVKTRSSKGGGASNCNEFRLEDKMGSELVLLHAEKDLTIEVEHDEMRTVLNDRTAKITNNDTTEVSSGNQSTTISAGNQSTQVSAGKIETEAMQSIELKVGQSSIKIDQMGVTIQGMTIKIQGQVQVQVQGTIVQVNGNAMVQVQGGIVMIN
jgi:type VI secretion system secreted protein VgrG